MHLVMPAKAKCGAWRDIIGEATTPEMAEIDRASTSLPMPMFIFRRPGYADHYQPAYLRAEAILRRQHFIEDFLL